MIFANYNVTVCNIFIQTFHMARPSQQLDLALLEAGEEELRLKGVRGLSVRAVCARAGVSPRMLNYYFESKDNFVRTLLVRGYKNFSREVEESARGTDAPLDRLRRGVRVCLRHTIEGRLTLRNLICDAYADDPVVSEILQERNSHTRIMYGLMEDAWRRGDLRRDVSPAEIFMAVMPGVFLPTLRMDTPFPFNIHRIREIADQVEQKYPDSEDGLRQEVEHGMRMFDLLLRGFLSKRHDGARSFRPPRTGRRAGSLKRRLASAHSGQGKAGEKTAEHAQSEGPGHIVHHAGQRGENAE